jgi:hypothetical protein
MKTLILSALIVASSLFTNAAEANPRTYQSIERALGIIDVEISAIYSGRYRSYRPETIRNILSQLHREAQSALASAESTEARTELSNLLRAISEEYGYSNRFQVYRLESTRLLLVNYQRQLQEAMQSEQLHGNDRRGFGPGRPCNAGGTRELCL